MSFPLPQSLIARNVCYICALRLYLNRSRSNSATSSHTATSGPPPVPLHTRPKIAPPQPPQPSQPSYIYPVSTPLSPPMTPEDLQTIAIPEDLFRYEPPPNQDSLLSSPISNATTVGGPIRGRGGRRIGRDFASGLEASESNHVGNGVPCRFLSKRSGCARGTQCAFSHASVHRGRPIRSTVLEEELARKNLGGRQNNFTLKDSDTVCRT
jgi:hypothetical protein